MGEIKAEIRSLAEEVAVTFESSAGDNNQNQQLPSSITIYQTGRVLYTSCHTSYIINESRAAILLSSFDNMISSLPNNYMHKLLQKLHLAYSSMILSYTKSSTTTCPTLSAITSMIGKSSHAASTSISEQDIIEGTESICGIYLSSQHCCMLHETSDGSSRKELELVFISLSWLYDYITSNEKKHGIDDESLTMQTSILKTLSTLLVHGCGLTVGKSFEEDQDEQISNIMTVIQNIQSALGDYNCALGDMLDKSVVELKEDDQFDKALRIKFEASDMSQPPQLQYLLAMLRSAPKSSDKKPSSSTIDNNNVSSHTETLSKPETQQTMTDIQIDHIKSILPVLGEGYIEEALKCYNHDVERTLEALLQVSEGGQNCNIHPRLLTIPNNLPRKLKESTNLYSANVNLHRGNSAKDDGKEHLQAQKKHIRHVEQQAEEEAFLIDSVSRSLGGLRVAEDDEDELISGMKDEYNDDYDDQYDGIGDGGLGDMDDGLYDVDVHNVHQKYDRGGAKNDQQMWRKYNNLIKDVDSESQFWEDNRNTNRTGSNQTGGNKNFGPDKGRGGRVIGPDGKYLPIKRGGKKGRGQPANNNTNQGRGGAGRGRGGGRGGRGGNGSSSKGGDPKPGNKKDGDDMSKIQKRRKNDNKAKVANHHRKDRANKKASGGMVM